MQAPLSAEPIGVARHARWGKLLVLCALLACAIPQFASALSIGVEFATSTHQVTAGDTYASLLAQHQAGVPLGSFSVPTLGNVSTAIIGGVSNDYSQLMTVDLGIAQTGLYTFQVGADWGRGGVAAILDTPSGTVLSEYVRTDDLWWNYDWNDPDVFTTQLNLVQGQLYTLAWLGFEDCCAGQSTIRFSFDGGAFQTLDSFSIAPYAMVPEPGTGLLVAAGVALLGARRRGSRRDRHPKPGAASTVGSRSGS